MADASPVLNLEQVLRRAAGQPLVVLLQGHPDPDSIGSAWAHRRICESLGVPTTIAHVLPVSHRENRALVKLLGIELLQISSPSDLARFTHLSLVDTCSVDPGFPLPSTLTLLTVVDHHRSGARTDAPFLDRRPTYGSTSTIYAEYLQRGLAPLTGARHEDAKIAAALLFGIQTDTDDFSLAGVEDFAAATYLRGHADVEVLRSIARRTVSAAAMNVLTRALTGLVVVRDFAMAGVGKVPVGNRDTIAQAADYIVAREDIDTVVVFGIVGDRIDGSLRTNSASVDPAVFLETAFGVDPFGKPVGGGRADKGGFQLPLGCLGESQDDDAVWRLADEFVRARLSRVVPDLSPQGPVGWQHQPAGHKKHGA
jgi:nanoRNase/pAp phosphatase (c-di-AMP/oligoRNAs hydrolase)